MTFAFWKKNSHYNLGYKPDYIGEFDNTSTADAFCNVYGYDTYDDYVI